MTDRERSPVVPFALGGFLVWLLMRQDCPPCSASGTGTGTGAGGTGTGSGASRPVVVVTVGANLGLSGLSDVFLYAKTLVPYSQSYDAVVEFKPNQFLVTKVFPAVGKVVDIRIGDRVRVVIPDGAGGWKKTAGF